MNYRHIYHAGNFADVFKHTILVALILALQHKEKACCYIDTHAGIGFYDLAATAARRSNESQQGIARIFANTATPPFVKHYIDIVKLLNQDNNTLRYYPGSPVLIHQLLRLQDRLLLSELHPEDYLQLRQVFQRDKQVTTYQQNGYQLLKAVLPPRERRGLVLIDPPFEDKAEFNHIVAAMTEALKRWETGIYTIWYPIKDRLAVHNFLRQLQRNIIKPMLQAELLIMSEHAPLQLKGCGMVIINPPWQLDEQLKAELAWLWQQLAINAAGSWKVEWLRAEN